MKDEPDFKVKCERCGEFVDPRVIEEHHIVPRSEGGTDNPENVQKVCANCHRLIHAERGEGRSAKAFDESPVFSTRRDVKNPLYAIDTINNFLIFFKRN